MSLLVVMNRGDSGLGLLAHDLQKRFKQVEFCYREEIVGIDFQAVPDALVLLGSDWSVVNPLVQVQVNAEVLLVRKFVELGVPTLGICFGAQLIAHAFGGSVGRGPITEIGWSQVVSDHEPAVLSGKWMQWHYDSFTAPPGFDVLASNDSAIQCIRRGHVVGVQFHPEFDEQCLVSWLGNGGDRELELLGISPQDLISETQHEVHLARSRSAEFLRWFLEVAATKPSKLT